MPKRYRIVSNRGLCKAKASLCSLGGSFRNVFPFRVILPIYPFSSIRYPVSILCHARYASRLYDWYSKSRFQSWTFNRVYTETNQEAEEKRGIVHTGYIGGFPVSERLRILVSLTPYGPYISIYFLRVIAEMPIEECQFPTGLRCARDVRREARYSTPSIVATWTI